MAKALEVHVEGKYVDVFVVEEDSLGGILTPKQARVVQAKFNKKMDAAIAKAEAANKPVVKKGGVKKKAGRKG